MAMAVLARTLSLQRANARARTFRRTDGSAISPEQIAVNSCRASQSIDALYVLSCLRDGLSPAEAFVSDEDSVCCSGGSKKRAFSSLSDRMERGSEMWDRDFSSMSSYGSDCAEISGKETLACSIKSDKLDALAEDFCLVFSAVSSSPSPPSSSDCCFPSRKSNPNEDDLRGLISRKTGSNQSGANLHETPRKSNHNEDDLRGLISRESSQSDANLLHTVSRKSKAKVDDLHNILGRSRPIVDADDHDLQCVLRESIAVEKFSCNPYQDFRESMLQMIMAKGLQRSMDMEDLLYSYLRLNSMEVHELIKRAFSDIWSELLMQIC